MWSLCSPDESRHYQLDPAAIALTARISSSMMGPSFQGTSAMPQTDPLADWQDLAEIVKPQAPLAPLTHLKIGGPAAALIQPRSVAELAEVVRRCGQRGLALHVL